MLASLCFSCILSLLSDSLRDASARMTPIKVVVADDHTLFREGLKKLLSLEKDILVVGEAARGDEVTKLVERTKPDVWLRDFKMPGGDAIQTLLEVREKLPPTKVLILSAYVDDDNVLNAAKGGARGYIFKGISSSTLTQAIRTVYGNGLWIDKELPAAQAFQEIAEGQLSQIGDSPADDVISLLTKRELEILKLVAEGLTNEEIGKKIFISEKTVKTHLTNIFDKLKVNNRFKAALFIMGRSSDTAPFTHTQGRRSR